MARTALSGLFGGPSELDVLDLISREEEAKSVQARAFPTSTASIAAAAQQEGKNALKKMLGGVASGLGLGVGRAGGLGLGVAVDPRLAKARKLETDKREIMGILQQYATDGFSEEEMRQGYALLMRKGYPEEARKFLADANMMVNMERSRASTKLDKAKAAAEGKDGGKGEVKAKTTMGKFSDPETDISYRQELLIYKNGDTEVVTVDENGNKYNEAQFNELMKTKKLQPIGPRGLRSDQRIAEAASKEAQKLWVADKRDAVKSLRTSRVKAEKIRQAVKILPQIRTGGLQQKFMRITNYFGVTSANVGQFNSITADAVIEALGEFGTNPTEGERKFAESTKAGMAQGRKVNDRILKELLKILQRKIADDSFMTKSGTTHKQYQSRISKRSQELSDDLLGLSDSFINPIKVPTNILNKSGDAVVAWLKKEKKATEGYYFIGPKGEIRQLGK